MSGDACAFPSCTGVPAIDSLMCVLHARVRISASGSDVDDKHSEGGHG